MIRALIETPFLLQTARFTSINSYPMPSVPENSSSSQQHIAIIENPPDTPIPTVICEMADSESNTEKQHQTEIELSTISESEATKNVNHLQVGPIIQRTTFNGSNNANTDPLLPPPFSNMQHISPPPLQRCRAFSVGVDSDMVSEFDPSSSDSGVASRCSGSVKPSKFRIFHPIFSKRYQRDLDVNVKNSGELEPVINKTDQKPRDPEKEKRRVARQKEKRATLILGVIMGCFIACWLPFFFLYILIPCCKARCNIPAPAFTFAFWLGYMNSAFNPVIYTIFNKDFRRAFRRILFK